MKGMQKIRRGTGFRGLVEYTLDHDHGRIIGGNMSGADARTLSAEFGVARRQRPDIAKPVWHNSLRLPAGEHIADEKWRAIAADYMRGMGFAEDHPYSLFLHDSAKGEHIHIVACRVSLSGSVYLGQNENLKSTKLIAALESAHKLAISAGVELNEHTGLPSTRSKKKKLKRGEIELSSRTGIIPPRAAIQAAIDIAAATARNAATDKEKLKIFTSELAARGVTLHVHKDPETGLPRGLSFEKDDIRFSGSQLGEDYKFKSLERRLSNAPPAAARIAAPQKEIQMQTQKQQTDSLVGFSIPGFHIPGSDSSTPPTLGGKLRAVPIQIGLGDRGYDLYWPDTGKPSFRWQIDQNRIISLASPSPKSVGALFDLAEEKGLGMPQITITGSTEFQILAAQEAARRGIPVDTQKLDPSARSMYEQTYSQQHGDAANSITASAYESADREADRLAREREAARPKNANDRDDERRTGQKMRA